MKKTTITVTEWYKALEDAQKNSKSDGFTVREAAEAMQCSSKIARDRLRGNVIIVKKRTIEAMDGRIVKVPAYKLKGQK